MRERGTPIVAGAVALLAVALPAAANDRPNPPAFDPAALRTAVTGRAAVADGPPPSLVAVAATDGSRRASACGVIVAERRDEIVILTTAHAVALDRATFVSAAGERLRVRSTTVVPGHDLALVTADRPWHRYAVAQLAPAPEIGARVHLWGRAGAAPFRLHDAVIRALDERVTDAPDGAFALDCAGCVYGDSGTGVFNARDELVGVVAAGYYTGATRVLVLGERYPK
jgi:S1-C subfamily serine protease